ncbi:MAG: hypothetical protein ACFCD0_20185 [Gemmataceae bacterium]
MSITRIVMFALAMVMFGSAGCCRMCERWCPQRCAAPPSYPVQYAAPPQAVVAAPPAVAASPQGQCYCIPVCPQRCAQSSPASVNSRVMQYPPSHLPVRSKPCGCN